MSIRQIDLIIGGTQIHEICIVDKTNPITIIELQGISSGSEVDVDEFRRSIINLAKGNSFTVTTRNSLNQPEVLTYVDANGITNQFTTLIYDTQARLSTATRVFTFRGKVWTQAITITYDSGCGMASKAETLSIV